MCYLSFVIKLLFHQNRMGADGGHEFDVALNGGMGVQ